MSSLARLKQPRLLFPRQRRRMLCESTSQPVFCSAATVRRATAAAVWAALAFAADMVTGV